MELRVLEYFIMVAKEGNITRAAERLHITQPTLSRQLSDLEKELNAQLFIRGKRSIVLTESGQLLMQRAQELMNLVAKTERDLSESNNQLTGTIGIGCVESEASRTLVRWMKTFRLSQSCVDFDLVSANGDDLREKLDRGMLDLAILLEPIESAKYDSIRLDIKERWGILLPVNHPYANNEYINVEQLKSLPLSLSRRSIVQDEMERWLGVSRDELNIIVTQNLLTNSLLLLSEGIAYPLTIEGAFTIRPDDKIRFVPFYPERITKHVLAWKKNQLLNPATRLFLQFINNALEA